MFSSTAPRRPSISSLPSSKCAFYFTSSRNNISAEGKSERLTFASDRLLYMIPNPLFYLQLFRTVSVADQGYLSGIPDSDPQHGVQYLPYMFVKTCSFLQNMQKYCMTSIGFYCGLRYSLN
jgi:hypothetical protein